MGKQFFKGRSHQGYIKGVMLLIILALVVIGSALFFGKTKLNLGAPTKNISSERASNAENILTSNQDQGSAVSFDIPIALTKTYSNSVFQYSLKYPNSWAYQVSSDGSVLFSAPNDTYDISVEVDKVSGNDLRAVVNQLKGDYTGDQSANAEISNDQGYTYAMKDGKKVEGKSFEVSYVDSYDNYNRYQDEIIVIPDGNLYILYIYSVPVDQYDSYAPVSQAMLESLVIGG